MMKILPLFLLGGLSVAVPSCRQKPVPSRLTPVKAVSAIAPGDFYRIAGNLSEKIVKAEVLARWLKEGSVVLIDVRSKEAFARSHLRGAINLPATEITDESLKRLVPSPETRIVIYCDDNLLPTRRIALTTLCNPAIYQLGYHNLFVLEELWHSQSCKADLNATMGLDYCPSLLPMETK